MLLLACDKHATHTVYIFFFHLLQPCACGQIKIKTMTILLSKAIPPHVMLLSPSFA